MKIFYIQMAEDKDIIGIIISILSITYNLPLVYRVVKRQSAKDIDLWFLILRIVTVTITIVYGYLIDDIFIIVSNIIPFISSLIILGVKIIKHNTPYIWNDLTKIIDKQKLTSGSPGWAEFLLKIQELSN